MMTLGELESQDDSSSEPSDSPSHSTPTLTMVTYLSQTLKTYFQKLNKLNKNGEHEVKLFLDKNNNT